MLLAVHALPAWRVGHSRQKAKRKKQTSAKMHTATGGVIDTG